MYSHDIITCIIIKHNFNTIKLIYNYKCIKDHICNIGWLRAKPKINSTSLITLSLFFVLPIK